MRSLETLVDAFMQEHHDPKPSCEQSNAVQKGSRDRQRTKRREDLNFLNIQFKFDMKKAKKCTKTLKSAMPDVVQPTSHTRT